MGVLDKLEGGIEDAFDIAGARVFKGTIEPAQVARRAEKQMKREKLVGTGKQYAPTLYTVLVSERDNGRLFAFYPTIAAEVETYLMSRGADAGLTFDCRPLVRFIVDKKLKSGRFDVVAESVAAAIIDELREEEAEYLNLKPKTPDNSVESDSRLPSQAVYQEAPNSGLREALRQAHGNFKADDEADDASYQEDSGYHEAAPDEPEPIEVASGHARLVNHPSGQSYDLILAKTTIGRDEVNDIVLNDTNASRRHAEFKQNALGVWKVIDLGSTNGTLVNGKVADQMVLRSGDQLTIGVTVLEFVYKSQADLAQDETPNRFKHSRLETKDASEDISKNTVEDAFEDT